MARIMDSLKDESFVCRAIRLLPEIWEKSSSGKDNTLIDVFIHLVIEINASSQVTQ